MRNLQATEGGVQYEVSEIRKALFAQRPGTFVIPPSRLMVQLVQSSQSRRGIDPFDGRSSPFDEFFGRMRTESVNLVHRADHGDRARSAAGAGGLLRAWSASSRSKASVSSTTLAVGRVADPEDRGVRAAGTCNLMGDLPLDELDGFKVYRDQPQVEISRSPNGIRGTKTFSRALVPMSAGAPRAARDPAGLLRPDAREPT